MSQDEGTFASRPFIALNHELKRKHAPRRDKRYAAFPTLDEAAAWCRSLEWRRNDYDFFRLCLALSDYLDSCYREYGFRIDQFVSREELLQAARAHIEMYDEENIDDCIDIFRFLYVSFDFWIGERADQVINQRRAIVEALEREIPRPTLNR